MKRDVEEEDPSPLDTSEANQDSNQKGLVEEKREEKKKFVCEYCVKEFPSLYKLMKHTRTHTLNCEICQITFVNDTQLARHTIMHSSTKPLTQDSCSKSKSDQSQLETLMRRCTNEERFICKSCDKSFSNNCYLLQHMRTHTGEKPFKCAT